MSLTSSIGRAQRVRQLLRRHEHLEELLSARATRQQAVARLGLRALSGIRLDELLSEATAVVCKTLGADFSDVFELEPGGASLVLRAGHGWRPGAVGAIRMDVGGGFQQGFVLTTGEPVIVRALERESRFVPSPLQHEHGVTSGITVIILDHDRALGVLGAYRRSARVFTANDVHFLQSVANLLAAALQRHRATAERESLLLQMRAAVAARDRAVGIVSHDLRNPLATIQICAHALLDPEPSPPEGIRNMAELILRSANWMQQIVQDLLDRSSLDANSLILKRRATPVVEVMSAAAAMFAPVVEDHALQFVMESSNDLPAVDADPSRVLQVISNLISNAMKFTKPGGKVLLGARTAQTGELDEARNTRRTAVRFAVGDTGCGIPLEDLPHVFDWFWHSGSGRSGSGLGLAIAKGLIEAHGCRLHVESEVGVGSTFWFALPSAV